MISRKVRLIYQRQWTWYIIISRTVRLIYQRQWTWYNIKDSAPDISKTVSLIWHQGQCTWYNIKFNNSPFRPARRIKSPTVGTPPSVNPHLQFSHVHFYLCSVMCILPEDWSACVLTIAPVKAGRSLCFITGTKQILIALTELWIQRNTCKIPTS
jgi:hypothetical protein